MAQHAESLFDEFDDHEADMAECRRLFRPADVEHGDEGDDDPRDLPVMREIEGAMRRDGRAM